MPKTVAQFAADAHSFAHDMPALERKVVGAAALKVKTTVLVEMRRIAPSLRLTGVSKRGAKIGVRYDQGHGSSTALVQATGPVQLIESPTRPHRIPKERQRGRRRIVVIPGVGPRASAQHPGTRGQHPWQKGVALSVPQIPKIIQTETHAQMGKYFGGR